MSVEQAAVAVESGLPAQVRVQHLRAGLDLASRHHVDHRGERLSFVDRVGEHSLETGSELDRVDGTLVRDPVGSGVVAVVKDDLVLAEVSADVDEGCGLASDSRYLIPGLRGLRRAVDAKHTPRLGLRGEPRDHAGLGAARDTAYDDGVEEDAQLPLLLFNLLRPSTAAEATERMIRSTGGEGIGPTAGSRDLSKSLVPTLLEPDPESRTDQPDIGAEDSTEQDVAHPVINRVRPVHPALLDQDAAHTRPCRRGCNLASVVR